MVLSTSLSGTGLVILNANGPPPMEDLPVRPSYTGLCNEKRRPQKQQKESLYPLSYPVFTAVTGAAAASSKGKGPGRTDLFLATPPNYPAWCSERTPSAGLSFFSRARWLT